MTKAAAVEATHSIRFMIEIGERGSFVRDLPMRFIPRQNDQMGIGPGGDFLDVASVWWAPDMPITVWLKDFEPTGRNNGVAAFRAAGWKAYRRPKSK